LGALPEIAAAFLAQRAGPLELTGRRRGRADRRACGIGAAHDPGHRHAADARRVGVEGTHIDDDPQDDHRRFVIVLLR
jgi:hypothetical protein